MSYTAFNCYEIVKLHYLNVTLTTQDTYGWKYVQQESRLYEFHPEFLDILKKGRQHNRNCPLKKILP
jgi:hypothetical protein